MKNLELNLKFGAVDGATVTVRKVDNSLRRLTHVWTPLEAATRRADMVNRRASRQLVALGREADHAERPLTRLWRRMEAIGRTRILPGLRRAGAGLAMVAGSAAGGLATVAAGATVGAGAAAFGLGKGVINTSSQFEGYLTLLETLEKSEAGAKRAMSWVEKFATTTPNRIDEVLSAYVKLRNFDMTRPMGH